MTILLFDIDGTLIRSGGAGKAAMEGALREEFGVAEIIDGVPFSGRTDLAIIHDLLALHGVEPTPAQCQRMLAAYLKLLPESLQANQGVELPGVRKLLEHLQNVPHVSVGLLTGNIRDGARCKLGHFDLWHFFAFGGFADGLSNRDDVARFALAEAGRHTGRSIEPVNVWVIGDTPLDVKCARAIGAKAVAVATGWHAIDELHNSGADHVLADLSDPAVLRAAWGL